jgi:hypothetical protein
MELEWSVVGRLGWSTRRPRFRHRVHQPSETHPVYIAPLTQERSKSLSWGMPSTNRQPGPKSLPSPGAVLLLVDGSICTMVKPGRQAPPLTIFVRRQSEPEREIPLADVADVMWSP